MSQTGTNIRAYSEIVSGAATCSKIRSFCPRPEVTGPAPQHSGVLAEGSESWPNRHQVKVP